MESANPYEAPSTPIGPEVTPVRASPWAPLRWFPATLCLIFALMGGVMTVFLFGQLVYLPIRFGLRPFELASVRPGWMIAKMLGCGLIFGLAATVGVSGSRAWMRRRWIWAVVALILSYLIMAAGVALLGQTESPRLPERIW